MVSSGGEAEETVRQQFHLLAFPLDPDGQGGATRSSSHAEVLEPPVLLTPKRIKNREFMVITETRKQL